MDNKILHELMHISCQLGDIRSAINASSKNKNNEYHLEIQFSKDKGEFAYQFLKLILAADESGSPIDFLKNCFRSNGESLYEHLSKLGIDLEQLFIDLNQIEGK